MADDAVNDLTVIQILVVILEVGVQQLVDDMPAVGRQAAAHMVPGMFAGDKPAQLDEPQEILAVPGIQIGLALLELGEFLVGIVDQSGEFGTLGIGHPLPQHRVDLFPDNARGTVENMDERLIFTV